MRYFITDMLHVMRELNKWMSDGAAIRHKKEIQLTAKYAMRTKN